MKQQTLLELGNLLLFKIADDSFLVFDALHAKSKTFGVLQEAKTYMLKAFYAAIDCRNNLFLHIHQT